MNTKQTLNKVFYSAIFRLGRRRIIHGVEVRLLLPEAPRIDLFAKVEMALGIVRTYGPEHFSRLQTFGNRILVFGDEGPVGEWIEDARFVKLAEYYVTSAGTLPEEVAATIVHETAHAWVEHRRVGYKPEHRRRIEALCFRTQASFVARIPHGAQLAAHYRESAAQVLAQPDSAWSNDAFRARDRQRIDALDLPAWLRRLLGGSSGGAASKGEATHSA